MNSILVHEFVGNIEAQRVEIGEDVEKGDQIDRPPGSELEIFEVV
jgi:hypothetical protein